MTASPARVAWAPAPSGRLARREVAWALVRKLAAEAGFAEVAITNPCRVCGGPHGGLRIAGAPLRASVSYAGGWAIAAVGSARIAAELGIDAEAERSEEPGLDRVLRHRGSLREWTRVEAALKADGRGLRIEPDQVRIAPLDRSTHWSLSALRYGGRTAYSGTERSETKRPDLDRERVSSRRSAPRSTTGEGERSLSERSETKRPDAADWYAHVPEQPAPLWGWDVAGPPGVLVSVAIVPRTEPGAPEGEAGRATP